MFPAALVCGFEWPGALALTIAWIGWRSPGWRVLGGDLAPHRDRYAGTFLRHCIAPVGFILAGIVILQRVEPAQLCYLIFPGIATCLAIWQRFKSNDGEDVNATVEIIRGASLGALIWAAWIL
jgi:hypothetical protein